MMEMILGEPQSPGPFLAEPLLNEPTSDHRVRYLACEALFNVAKVAREARSTSSMMYIMRLHSIILCCIIYVIS